MRRFVDTDKKVYVTVRAFLPPGIRAKEPCRVDGCTFQAILNSVNRHYSLRIKPMQECLHLLLFPLPACVSDQTGVIYPKNFMRQLKLLLLLSQLYVLAMSFKKTNGCATCQRLAAQKTTSDKNLTNLEHMDRITGANAQSTLKNVVIFVPKNVHSSLIVKNVNFFGNVSTDL